MSATIQEELPQSRVNQLHTKWAFRVIPWGCSQEWEYDRVSGHAESPSTSRCQFRSPHAGRFQRLVFRAVQVVFGQSGYSSFEGVAVGLIPSTPAKSRFQ